MFLVDKPKGITSSRVVERIKKKFNVKAGHHGDLRPPGYGAFSCSHRQVHEKRLLIP